MFTYRQLSEMLSYLSEDELDRPVIVWDEGTNLYLPVKYSVNDIIVSQGADDIADGSPLLCLE